MPRDALDQLLRAADATAPAPPVASDLPARVRRRQLRRTYRITAAATAATLLLLVTALLRQPRQAQIVTADPRTAARELQALDLQAALHEQTAAHLLAAAPTRSAPVIAPAIDPVLAEVRQQRDRAALILVYEAEQAAREKKTDRAVAAYRRTIELFPTTYWAGVAHQRLKEMST